MAPRSLCTAAAIALFCVAQGCAPKAEPVRSVAPPIATQQASAPAPVLQVELTEAQLILGGKLMTEPTNTAAISRAFADSGAQRVRLVASDEVRCDALLGLLQAAKQGGFARASLVLSDSAEIPVGLPETDQHPGQITGALAEPGVAELVLHADQVMLQSAKGSKAPGYSLPLTNLEAHLPKLLGEACAQHSPCSALIVRLNADARVLHLKDVLETAHGDFGVVTLTAYELVAAQPDGQDSPKAKPARSGERLPEETIREVVRQSFGNFRSCYEEGLLRDPSLTGRVTVAFVINRKGAVSTAEARRAPKQKQGAAPPKTGTTITDPAVVQCVLKRFKELTFPAPTRGTVPVVYPIEFSPAGAP